MLNQPTQSDIRTAKRQAVGGRRKRCRKGKNCSAACIAPDMACLVEMPESAGVATTKVRNMLQQKVTPKAREYFRKKGIVRGNYGGGTPVSTLDADRKAPLSSTDLDLMEKSWKRYTKTGELEFPFKMPKKYDNNSGTPEAVNEIVSLRNQLQQDKKTGRITIPEGVKVSKLARELINEWNSLDLSTVYVNSAQGNRLNVSGLGVTAGPRNSVPKDAVRGLIQYVALRRQQAELEDTPDGKRITSYRDPFTGQRRPYMIGNSVVASQDHWQRPFGIYGILSENDVKNTVYMPNSINTNKGESSPARYLHKTLIKNGRLQDTSSPNKNALGGFEHRYDKDGTKDFLPKGLTRESEKAALRDTSFKMVKLATDQITEKHIPRIEKALQGEPTMDQAAKLIHGIVKQESTGNYYGRYLRFTDGQRILTPYEQNLTKGVNINKTDPVVIKGLKEQMVASGKTPKQLLQEVLQNRQGYVPKPTGGSEAPAAATPKAKKAPNATKPPTTKNLTEDQKERVETAARMTNSRIEKRLNERQFYDDATNKRIREANEKVVAPFQKMSDDEKGALALYGQQGVKHFEQVNQLLRSGKMENSSPDKVKMAEFISSNLKSGLEKLPPAKVEELGRAVSGNFATSLSSLKPGDTITDKGFGSYTNKGNPVYDQFFSKTEPNASIRILNPKGAREVAPVMEYTQEGEHITLPGTRLRLVDVQEKGVYSRKTGGYIPQYTFEEIEE